MLDTEGDQEGRGAVQVGGARMLATPISAGQVDVGRRGCKHGKEQDSPPNIDLEGLGMVCRAGTAQEGIAREAREPEEVGRRVETLRRFKWMGLLETSGFY